MGGGGYGIVMSPHHVMVWGGGGGGLYGTVMYMMWQHHVMSRILWNCNIHDVAALRYVVCRC